MFNILYSLNLSEFYCRNVLVVRFWCIWLNVSTEPLNSSSATHVRTITEPRSTDRLVLRCSAGFFVFMRWFSHTHILQNPLHSFTMFSPSHFFRKNSNRQLTSLWSMFALFELRSSLLQLHVKHLEPGVHCVKIIINDILSSNSSSSKHSTVKEIVIEVVKIALVLVIEVIVIIIINNIIVVVLFMIEMLILVLVYI